MMSSAVLIGNWINEGHTIGTGPSPSLPIATSDVYEWAPGGLDVTLRKVTSP
jgi:hypothetical protein